MDCRGLFLSEDGKLFSRYKRHFVPSDSLAQELIQKWPVYDGSEINDWVKIRKDENSDSDFGVRIFRNKKPVEVEPRYDSFCPIYFQIAADFMKNHVVPSNVCLKMKIRKNGIFVKALERILMVMLLM
uniref:Uncharacterized protein n=1 Tax=Meloidogyne enterolobii TaxID=390850 RepID=A0A6V7W2L1_MELEN|nr:unnamed protein product [Meloidogyne enterolobii]